MQPPGANGGIGGSSGSSISVSGSSSSSRSIRSAWVTLLEAAQVNFPHMRLALQGSNRLVTVLDGDASVLSTPFAIPWRVIMVAEKPGQLLENNYLVLNLNPPNALAGTS